MTIRNALIEEITRLKGLVAEYEQHRIALGNAQRALAALDGKKNAVVRRNERGQPYNTGGLPKRIMDWLTPGEEVDAKRIEHEFSSNRSASTVALNRLCHAGKLIRVSPGRFRLVVSEGRSA